MPLKKYINGSWVDTSYKRYETGTDAVTNLPVTILTDGQPVTSWTMKGNTTTSGTPSPQNPVTINGVGEETANLYNIDTFKSGYYIRAGNTSSTSPLGSEGSSGSFSCSDYIEVEPNEKYTVKYPRISSAASAGAVFFDSSKNAVSGIPLDQQTKVYVFTVPPDCTYIRISWRNEDGNEVMFVKGEYTSETIPPYDHFGFKISILKDSQALTPIYLGDVQTTRKIVKFVLDGTEDWEYVTASNGYARLIIGTINQYMSNFILCTHLTQAQITTSTTDFGCNVSNPASKNASVVVLRLSGISPSVEAYKSFLAEQYAAGTPVTVWVVLTNAITSTVNEPLMKIDEYADSIDSTQSSVTIPTTGGTVTLDVDTTVKPSELDLTYHGWHEHQPLKYNNGSWS